MADAIYEAVALVCPVRPTIALHAVRFRAGSQAIRLAVVMTRTGRTDYPSVNSL